MSERRIVSVPIDRRRIIDFITGIDVIIMKDGTTRKITGIPDGTKLEQVYYDASYDSIRFILSHPDFPELDEGVFIPHPIITETTLYCRHSHFHLTEDDSEFEVKGEEND